MEELIKAELKRQGLSEDLVSKITVENESEIEAAVKAFKESQKKSLAEFLKENGYEDDFNRHIQSETDRRVTQAIKTYEEKHPRPKPPEKKEDENMTEEQKRIKELTETVEKLTNTVTQLQDGTRVSSLKTLATEAIKKAKLPESWVDRVNVEKAEDIEGVVEQLTEEYNTIQQSIIDEKLENGGVLKSSPGTVTDKEIDSFAETLSEEQSVPVEKI